MCSCKCTQHPQRAVIGLKLGKQMASMMQGEIPSDTRFTGGDITKMLLFTSTNTRKPQSGQRLCGGRWFQFGVKGEK